MDNQERNREALIEHIAEQDRIIRRRNEQISRQADRIADVVTRKDELARELAAAVTRAEKAEMESGRAAEVAERWRESYDSLVSIRRADPHRPLTADDISEQMVTRFMVHEYGIFEQDAVSDEWADDRSNARESLTAALTEPPARPEGAEKVEAVLNQYWSGDIDGTDLADRIVEEMNR